MSKMEESINEAISSIRSDIEEIKASDNQHMAAINKWNSLEKNYRYLQIANKEYKKATTEYEEAKKLIATLDKDFVEKFNQTVENN